MLYSKTPIYKYKTITHVLRDHIFCLHRIMETTVNNEKISKPHVELVVDEPTGAILQHRGSLIIIKESLLSVLARFHAGYFRISLSLCSQALLWKILGESEEDAHALRRVFRMLPSAAFVFLWTLALLMLASLSLLYIFRCLCHFEMVKAEFSHHVGVNYLFAPWISWLLLLQSSPFLNPKATHYLVLCLAFVVPVLVLDVKIYGQWFTKGKRSLSAVANPTSQLSVIGNLVGARAVAEMGWRESAVFLFSLGMAHYLVLFVTLYQRLSGSNCLPTALRPVFFLFFAAPSMASLAWNSISGRFDSASKMLFFLSLFLFLCLGSARILTLKSTLSALCYNYMSWEGTLSKNVSNPSRFKKCTRRFNVAWWAYSFPLTILALASVDYAEEVKDTPAHGAMLVISSLSLLLALLLMALTLLNINLLLPQDDPVLKS